MFAVSGGEIQLIPDSEVRDLCVTLSHSLNALQFPCLSLLCSNNNCTSVKMHNCCCRAIITWVLLRNQIGSDSLKHVGNVDISAPYDVCVIEVETGGGRGASSSWSLSLWRMPISTRQPPPPTSYYHHHPTLPRSCHLKARAERSLFHMEKSFFFSLYTNRETFSTT